MNALEGAGKVLDSRYQASERKDKASGRKGKGSEGKGKISGTKSMRFLGNGTRMMTLGQLSWFKAVSLRLTKLRIRDWNSISENRLLGRS